MLQKCLILWTCYFVACSNAGTVPWIKPCPSLDLACTIKSVENALPHVVNGSEEYGIPPIDPLSIKDTIAETGDFKVTFKNVMIYQLSKCKFVSFTRDLVKSTATVTSECPTFIKGQYTMGGTLLLIDIVGDGGFTIEGGIVRTITDIKLKTFTKEGKKHYKISSFDYKFEPITKHKLTFENLFNGDKEKAEPVEKVMNDAWKELIVDIGKPIMKEIMTSLASFIDKIFKVIPVDELEIV